MATKRSETQSTIPRILQRQLGTLGLVLLLLACALLSPQASAAEPSRRRSAPKPDLSKAASLKISTTLTTLMSNQTLRDKGQAFVTPLLLQMPRKQTTDTKVMKTDGHRLYYNPEGVMASEDLPYQLSRVVLHAALGHTTRRASRDKARWDKASALVTNNLLKLIGHKLPEGAITDPNLKDLSVEQAFEKMRPEQQADTAGVELADATAKKSASDRGKHDQQAGQPSDQTSKGDQIDNAGKAGRADKNGQADKDGKNGKNGKADKNDKNGAQGKQGRAGQDDEAAGGEQASGSNPRAGQTGNDGTTSGSDGPARAGNALGGTSQGGGAGSSDRSPTDGTGDGRDSESSARGTDTGYGASDTTAGDLEAMWRSKLETEMNKARAQGFLPGDIDRQLSELLSPKIPWKQLLENIANELALHDYSYRRPKEQGEFILPTLHDDTAHVVAAFDTSGSISESELRENASELGGILMTGQARVTALAADAEVQGEPMTFEVGEPLDGSKLKLGGGGGTDFRPVFQWVEENQTRPDLLVYFTDAKGDFPEVEPGYPVLWVVKGPTEVPWGQRAQLD